VVHFAVTARGVRGDVVSDLPITFSVKSNVEDTVIASEPPAQVEQDGRFVAQRAGDYTVIASAGSLVASKTIAVDHRFTSIRIADLAVTPHGSKLVVTTLDSRYAAPTLEGIGGDPGTIDIIDLTRLVKVATVEIGKQAGGIAVLPRVPPSR
jgi:hypothetical protein